MLRYYKIALRELEEKSNGKYQVEEHYYHKQDLNNGGEVEGCRDDLSKESKVRESSHKKGNKRDRELRRKKKKRKKTTETALATKHDHVADENRKKTKKEKKRRLENIDVEATTSDERESCKTKFHKSRTEPQIVSNNKKIKKKRKRDYLSELSEGAVKKIKHSVQTTESEKHRDEEKCDDIFLSCNQRTEDVHTSVESSTLARSRYSYVIAPSGSSSLQSNTHHSKKASGKVSTKEGHKKKEKKRRNKMREDLTTNKVVLVDGNNYYNNAIDSIVEPSFIILSTIKMDKAKLREATVISNKIQETSRISEERLKALAEQGEYK